VLLTISIGVDAQTMPPMSGVYDLNTSLIMNEASEFKDVKGSPYLYDDAVEGIIVTEDKQKYTVYLKYNVYHDRMEFSLNPSFIDPKALPTTGNVNVYLGESKFKHMDLMEGENVRSGYFEVLLTEVDTPVLIKRYQRSIIESDRSQSSAYMSKTSERKMRSDDKYYILEGDNIIEIDNHKKKSLDVLPSEFKDQLKDYIKDNKIKFRDDEIGLIALIIEYGRIRN
jgi:hypothetical protein